MVTEVENRVTGHQPSAVKDFGRRPPNLGTEKEASGMVRKGQGPLPTGPLCPSEGLGGVGLPQTPLRAAVGQSAPATLLAPTQGPFSLWNNSRSKNHSTATSLQGLTASVVARGHELAFAELMSTTAIFLSAVNNSGGCSGCAQPHCLPRSRPAAEICRKARRLGWP